MKKTMIQRSAALAVVAFCLVSVLFVTLVTTGASNSITVLDSVSAPKKLNGHSHSATSAATRDYLEARKEKRVAEIEMTKSKVVQKEAALDDDRAAVRNLRSRLQSGEKRLTALEHQMARQKKEEANYERKKRRVESLVKADKATEANFQMEEASHHKNIPLLSAGIPAEKKSLSQKRKAWNKLDQAALAAADKYTELQRDAATELHAAIRREENAQTDFALSAATVKRQKQIKAKMDADIPEINSLLKQMPLVQKQLDASKLKYKMEEEVMEGKADRSRALQLKLASLKSKMKEIIIKTGVSAKKAVAKLSTGELLSSPTSEEAEMAKEASIAEDGSRLAEKDHMGPLSSLSSPTPQSSSLNSELNVLAQKAKIAAEAAAQYKALLKK